MNTVAKSHKVFVLAPDYSESPRSAIRDNVTIMNCVTGGLKLLNSGGIKLSTCQSLTSKLRGWLMLDLEKFLMLRDLFNQELSISEIARRTGHSRGTVRKCLLSPVPPAPQKRQKKPSKLDDYKGYIAARLQEYPLSAKRIYREIQEKGFTGKYTIVKDFVREIRPRTSVAA